MGNSITSTSSTISIESLAQTNNYMTSSGPISSDQSLKSSMSFNEPISSGSMIDFKKRKSSLSNLRKCNTELFFSNFIIVKEIKKAKHSKGKLFLVAKKNNVEKNYVMFSIRRNETTISPKEFEAFKEEIYKCDNPFISKIRYFFEKSSHYYFLQNYYKISNFESFLNENTGFNEELIRFYAAELIIALQELPKNQTILNKIIFSFNTKKLFFDENGHLILNILPILLKNQEEQSWDYQPPEVINNQKFTFSNAFAWMIGIFLYELLTGHRPFNSKDEILHEEIRLYMKSSNKCIVDLIQKLLIKNPLKRFGLGEIKDHEFFKNIDWEIIKSQDLIGPILKIAGIDETSEKNHKNEIFSFKDMDNLEEFN